MLKNVFKCFNINEQTNFSFKIWKLCFFLLCVRHTLLELIGSWVWKALEICPRIHLENHKFLVISLIGDILILCVYAPVTTRMSVSFWKAVVLCYILQTNQCAMLDLLTYLNIRLYDLDILNHIIWYFGILSCSFLTGKILFTDRERCSLYLRWVHDSKFYAC